MTVALTFLGLLVVTFLIGRVVPVDPVLAVVGDRAPQSVYDRVYLELGLDKPLWQQFLIYLRKVLTGDFGKSLLTKNPILADIRRVFPATLELATVGILIGTLVGVPMGVLAAVRHGRLADQVVRVLGLVGYSAPIFWLGLLGAPRLLRPARLGRGAGPHRHRLRVRRHPPDRPPARRQRAAGPLGRLPQRLRHIILPASLLGYFSMAYISRMTRSFMLQRARARNTSTTARVKGLSEWRIIWGHALAQRRGAARHRHRALLRRPARRLGADRDRLRLAGPRPVPDQLAAERRHERRARRHAGDRRRLRRPQPRSPTCSTPCSTRACAGDDRDRATGSSPTSRPRAARRGSARPTAPGSPSAPTASPWSASPSSSC